MIRLSSSLSKELNNLRSSQTGGGGELNLKGGLRKVKGFTLPLQILRTEDAEKNLNNMNSNNNKNNKSSTYNNDEQEKGIEDITESVSSRATEQQIREEMGNTFETPGAPMEIENILTELHNKEEKEHDTIESADSKLKGINHLIDAIQGMFELCLN